LKKNKRNIVYAWVLVLLFAAGQYMVYAHTHYKQGNVVSTEKNHLTVLKEKCDICDVMHHTHMLLTQHIYFTPSVAVLCQYQDKTADITLIQLVLASGRAPPVAIS
jgi:hypothetical protein